MKKEKLNQKKSQAQKAVNAFHRGKFKSLRSCAKYYKVPKSTLYDLVTTGDELKGRGRKLRCMTSDEESKIVAHVKWRASVGCVLEWRQLQSIIQAAAFCKQKSIQPWLHKPNLTHILQPCDLTFFSSLKKQLKKLAWDWQCTPSNAGNTLNKYSIVALLHQATELCLHYH